MVIGGISTVNGNKLPPKVLFSFGAFSFFYQETRKDTIKNTQENERKTGEPSEAYSNAGEPSVAYGDAGEPPAAYGDGIVNAVIPNVAKVRLCRNDKNRLF